MQVNDVRKHSFDNMPRTRKVCPICEKKDLLKLSNQLADVHKLSSEERQSYLIRATKMPIDIATVLAQTERQTDGQTGGWADALLNIR